MRQLLATASQSTLFLFVAVFFASGLLGGEGPFDTPVDIANGSVSGVTSLVAGDINGDSRADVVVIEGGKHAGGRKTFAWFEAPSNDHDGWQRHDLRVSAPLRPFLGAARLADLDGDGDLDLVVSSDEHSGKRMKADIFAFVNPRPDGNATEVWPMHRVSPTMQVHHINDMEIDDMDGDGKLDVICRSLEPNQIHIFFQNGLTSFDHRTIDTGLARSEGLAVGRLDDDPLPDIEFTGYWLRSPQRPRVDRYARAAIDAGYAEVNQNTKDTIGDIDGDGRNDVVIGPAEAYRGGKNHVLAWYRYVGGEGDRPWKQYVIEHEVNNTHTVRLGDLDGDGDLDLLAGVPWSRGRIHKTVRVYYNNGTGTFTECQTVVEGKGLYTGALVDVNNDGALDIIGQDTYSNDSKPWLYRNLRAQ